MTQDLVLKLAREALQISFLVSGPLLLVSLVVGVLVSVVQVVTSLQDMTVSTVPRLAAVAALVLFLMPWMARRIGTFTVQLFSDFGPFVR